MKKREQWFAKWLNKHPTPLQEDTIHFHLFGGENDRHNDLLMNRDGLVHTVSITSIELTKEKGSMTYFDLKDYSLHQYELAFYAPYAIQ